MAIQAQALRLDAPHSHFFRDLVRLGVARHLTEGLEMMRAFPGLGLLLVTFSASIRTDDLGRIGRNFYRALATQQAEGKAKGIEIASYVDERLPDQVVGDAARLRQVLLNRAGNAIKFTEKGGVAVIVEPGERDGDIRFLVRDTGIGLRDEDQARIFLDFEQADGSSTRKFGGTGLGLAISRRIVERMGGRVDIRLVEERAER
jgi:signal transduction histidine kinase